MEYFIKHFEPIVFGTIGLYYAGKFLYRKAMYGTTLMQQLGSDERPAWKTDSNFIDNI